MKKSRGLRKLKPGRTEISCGLCEWRASCAEQWTELAVTEHMILYHPGAFFLENPGILRGLAALGEGIAKAVSGGK